MTDVDRAWDALPPQEETEIGTYDQTPESAALRGLFGQSAFRLLGNSGVEHSTDRDLLVVEAIQARIARAYLFAIEAFKAKPGKPGKS